MKSSILTKLSLVIPVFNEEETLISLDESVHNALQEFGTNWEVIYIDDGSQDGSLKILADLAEADKEHVRVVHFRRNFGQTAAIAAGIDYARGEIIVTLDADMQNDPTDIPMMVAKLNEGYDVVSGYRKDRKDTLITRKIPSQAANWLISLVTGVHLHDYGCTLKAYRREVLQNIRLYGEMHRFIPVYAHAYGARITELQVRHHPRKFGKTKYGLDRTLKVILDLFTVKFLLSYSAKPIYLFGGAGVILILLSGLVLFYLLVRRIFFSISVLASPLFQMSAMVFILGFQSILMGLIAELLVRTYHESQKKPTYTVRTAINFDSNKISDD
ncbi:glycosyltransferase family 2 protein [Chloroflexota bacterium]